MGWLLALALWGFASCVVSIVVGWILFAGQNELHNGQMRVTPRAEGASSSGAPAPTFNDRKRMLCWSCPFFRQDLRTPPQCRE
ncbi:MAG: hypothetical protein ACRCZI_11110 [Cetobacterium sp.]